MTPDELLKVVLYDHPTRIVSGFDPVTGGLDENLPVLRDSKAKKYCEQQKYGGDLIVAGQVELGLKMLLFAIEYLDTRAGTFENNVDNWHSAGLYLCGVTEALHSPNLPESRYKKERDALLKCLNTNLEWMLRTDDDANPGKQQGEKRDAPYTHRKFKMACLMYEAINVLPSSPHRWELYASQYLTAGLAAQMASGSDWDGISRDGVFPEKWTKGVNSGWDASYQNASIRFLARCHRFAELKMKERIVDALRRGCRFMDRIILPDGKVNATGSTRVGQEEARSGEIKGIDGPNSIRGLCYAARVTGDQWITDLAEKVAKGKKWL